MSARLSRSPTRYVRTFKWLSNTSRILCSSTRARSLVWEKGRKIRQKYYRQATAKHKEWQIMGQFQQQKHFWSIVVTVVEGQYSNPPILQILCHCSNSFIGHWQISLYRWQIPLPAINIQSIPSNCKSDFILQLPCGKSKINIKYFWNLWKNINKRKGVLGLEFVNIPSTHWPTCCSCLHQS